MFTSEPALAQRIERMIAESPIVDPHTRLRPDRLGAPDLAALLGDPGVRGGLAAAGMPRADRDPALAAEERVRRALPYLRKIRNTAPAWCLYRIVRDLYDFDEPDLTEANFGSVLDRVARTGCDPAWARSVLEERCHIRTVATSLANRPADPQESPPEVFFGLDLDMLFRPGAPDPSSGSAGRGARSEYYEVLCGLIGERPATLEGLSRRLRDWLDHTVEGRVRFSSVRVEPGASLLPPDASHAQFVLTQAADDWDLSDPDIDALARFVAWEVLGWHHDNRKTIRLVARAEDFARSESSSPGAWSPTFHRFFGARFDLSEAPERHASEVLALAAQFPNVSVSGDPWPTTSAASIASSVSRRIHSVPISKLIGFSSGATSVEWVYGKLQLVKKAMAAALARLVEAGFYDEDELPPLLHQLLHDSPRALYDLGPPAP